MRAGTAGLWVPTDRRKNTEPGWKFYQQIVAFFCRFSRVSHDKYKNGSPTPIKRLLTFLPYTLAQKKKKNPHNILIHSHRQAHRFKGTSVAQLIKATPTNGLHIVFNAINVKIVVPSKGTQKLQVLHVILLYVGIHPSYANLGFRLEHNSLHKNIHFIIRFRFSRTV